MKAQSGFVSNAMDLDFGFTLLWDMCSVGCVVEAMIHSIMFMKDLLDLKDFSLELGCVLCALEMMGGTQLLSTEGWRIWYPWMLWLIRALKWQFDSLEKTGQEQTLSSWTTQYMRVIFFIEQSHLTVGWKGTDGQRLLGPLPAKEDIPFVWINGNLLVCIVHWSTETKSVICTNI